MCEYSVIFSIFYRDEDKLFSLPTYLWYFEKSKKTIEIGELQWIAWCDCVLFIFICSSKIKEKNWKLQYNELREKNGTKKKKVPWNIGNTVEI